MKIPKELKKALRAAEEQGWKVEPTKGSHTKWIPPNPEHSIVIHSGSASDPRAIKNHMARLKDRNLIL